MGNFRWMRVLIGMLAVLVLAAGCAKENTVGSNAADREGFTIITSFYPMYITAVNVAKGIDGVTVKNMTKPQSGCLHDYQLTPEDMRALEGADALIVNGAGMESFLEKVVAAHDQLKVIEASRGIALLKDGEHENPHVWVSVSGAIAQTRNIMTQLMQADPAHAGQYEKNGAAYIEKLNTLKEEMHKEIDGLPHKEIVTFHEAFPYFAEEFGLRIAAVIEREPGSEPSPKELEETIEQVKSLDIRAMFTEPQYPARAAQIIARESGGKVYVLDPVVTGEANAEALDAYIEAMRENARVLKEALS